MTATLPTPTSPLETSQAILQASVETAFGQSIEGIKAIITHREADTQTAALNQILIETIVDHIKTLLDLPQKETMDLIGTSASQKSRNKIVNLEIADRSFIVLEVFARISAKMGEERARTWIKSPKKALNNRTPLELLNTRVGLQELDEYLNALEDGAYS